MFGFAQGSCSFVNDVGFLLFVWCVGALGFVVCLFVAFFFCSVPFDYFADCKQAVETSILTTKKEFCFKIYEFMIKVRFIKHFSQKIIYSHFF